MPKEPTTRNEAVLNLIREDILSGALPPGSRLRFAEMSSRYGTSVGVVREALSRIAEQGLVRSEPQLGFSVTPVSLKDLQDLTDARCDVEGLTLRYAVLNGDLEWEGGIVSAQHKLQRTPTHLDAEREVFNEDWVAAHNAFHLALLAGCPNERLLSISLGLRDAAEVYRRAVQRPVGSAAQRDAGAEHKELADAAVARDADRAVAALVRHIRATTDYLVANSQSIFDDVPA